MKFEFKFKNLERYQDRIKQFPTKANNAAKIAMGIFTTKTKTDIKKILNVRGEPDGIPRKRTGHLYESVYSIVEVPKQFIIVGRVGDNAEYAGWLEEGTSKMPPRPYIRPTMEQNKHFFEDLMVATMKKL